MEAAARKIIGGIVGGGLAAAVGTGVTGAAGNLAGMSAMSGSEVLMQLVQGAGMGLVAAQVFAALPRSFAARAGILAAAAIVGQILIRGTHGLMPVVLGEVAYGVVLAFVLRQVITLPLPLWKPMRRADEFKDIRAESH